MHKVIHCSFICINKRLESTRMNKQGYISFCISNDPNLVKYNHHGFYFAQGFCRAELRQGIARMTCLCSPRGGCLLQDPNERRCLEVKLGQGEG